MYYGKFKSEAELEYERKYGNKTHAEMDGIVSDMINQKLAGARERVERMQAERDAKYNLSYGELVKAVAKTRKQIKELEGTPENLLSAKRKDIEAEYDSLVERGMSDVNKELWVSEEIVKYMQESEYREAKSQLQQARTDYAIYLSKKAQWEEDNADIIMSERIRTKRAELLQADPEALRELGIEPPVTGLKTTSKREETEEEKALKAMEIDTDAILHIMNIRSNNEE